MLYHLSYYIKPYSVCGKYISSINQITVNEMSYKFSWFNWPTELSNCEMVLIGGSRGGNGSTPYFLKFEMTVLSVSLTDVILTTLKVAIVHKYKKWWMIKQR